MLLTRHDLSDNQFELLVFITKQSVRSVQTDPVNKLVDLGLICHRDGYLRATHSAWSLLLCGATRLAPAE
ncbi:hypothetical protein [Chthonobacter albigriseus]|uniref:hypothetical protein n=1 Tax=Chthonobacter albigriseus TaxID=1683161 RepID=UPI0015EFAFE0|nr:hypothetical protein [Chthonobacter albigriseus]